MIRASPSRLQLRMPPGVARNTEHLSSPPNVPATTCELRTRSSLFSKDLSCDVLRLMEEAVQRSPLSTSEWAGTAKGATAVTSPYLADLAVTAQVNEEPSSWQIATQTHSQLFMCIGCYSLACALMLSACF